MSGSTNRRKGHRAEQEYARRFREAGFSYCQTSRRASRLHDDAGIDLVNLPVSIQIKSGYQRGLNVSALLAEIREKIRHIFPTTSSERMAPLAILHRKPGRPGQPRQPEDEIVSMTFEDFLTILTGERHAND